MTNPTGFDAFFNAMTSSPEFKAGMEKDWAGDSKKMMDLSIEKMDETFKKASEMTSSFGKEFATPEAFEAGNQTQSGGTQTKGDDAKTPIKIEFPVMKDPETWGFKGIAGMDKLKDDLLSGFIRPLKFKFLVQNLGKETSELKEDDEKTKVYKALYEQYEKFRVSIPTGLLFYGPPGTGKTFITKKLAEELGAGVIQKSLGEFGSSYVHATSKNIKDFFDQAKEASQDKPIILFLDEIDSLLSKRTDNIDATKAEEISQFLQEFNKLAEEAPNLIVVAATNRPDHLDAAILRSGRLDKKIYIGPPDTEARKELFEIYIQKQDRPHEKIDFDKLAILTEGYVASDIEAICDEVSRDASSHILDIANSIDDIDFDAAKVLADLGKNKINMEQVEKAIKDTVSSIKTTDMSIYEKWAKQIEA